MRQKASGEIIMATLIITEKVAGQTVRSMELIDPEDIERELHNQIVSQQSLIASSNTMAEVLMLNNKQLEEKLQWANLQNLGLQIQISKMVQAICRPQISLN
jgi:hypothetical protein